MADITFWQAVSPLLVSILGAIAALIAVISNSNKTAAEAKRLRLQNNEILHQVQNNGGHSMKDGVDKAVTLASQQSESLGKLSASVESLIHEVRGVKDSVNHLAQVDILDRKQADDNNHRLEKSIDTLSKAFKSHVDEMPAVMEQFREEAFKIYDERNKKHETQ